MKEFQIYTKESTEGTKYVDAIHKDGWNWAAAIITGLWLIANRMWKIFFLTYIFNIGLGVIVDALYPYTDTSYFYLGVYVLQIGIFGLYGNCWKIHYMKEHGHEFRGIIRAKNANQAKLQWLTDDKLEEFKRSNDCQPINSPS